MKPAPPKIAVPKPPRPDLLPAPHRGHTAQAQSEPTGRARSGAPRPDLLPAKMRTGAAQPKSMLPLPPRAPLSLPAQMIQASAARHARRLAALRPRTVAQAMMQEDAPSSQPPSLPHLQPQPEGATNWQRCVNACFEEARKWPTTMGEMGRISGKGWCYALLAQAIRNDVLAEIQLAAHWIDKLDPIIAVTEVSHTIPGSGTWSVWLIGASIRAPLEEYLVHALQKLSPRLEALAAATQSTLVVIPCNGWGQDFLQRAAETWSLAEGTELHAEQQIVAYLEHMPVVMVCREIGVSHFLGPCSSKTAGTGSQECKAELTKERLGAAWLTAESTFKNVQLSSFF